MKYTKKQLNKIYMDAVCEEITEYELLPISTQLSLICKYVQFSPLLMEEIIDALLDVYHYGKLYLVNQELLDSFMTISNQKRKSDFIAYELPSYIYAVTYSKSKPIDTKHELKYTIDAFNNAIRFICLGFPNENTMKLLEKDNSELYYICLEFIEAMKLVDKLNLSMFERADVIDYLTTSASVTYIGLDKINEVLDRSIEKEEDNMTRKLSSQ